MLTQEWITKISAEPEGDPIIGRSDEDDAKDAWALRYIAALISVGIGLRIACQMYSGGEHDYSEDAHASALENLSYFDDY